MVTHASLTDQSIASGGVDDRVDQIHAQTSAELTIQSSGGTLTTEGSEQTLYQDDEPLGVWCPGALILDVDDMRDVAPNAVGCRYLPWLSEGLGCGTWSTGHSRCSGSARTR